MVGPAGSVDFKQPVCGMGALRSADMGLSARHRKAGAARTLAGSVTHEPFSLYSIWDARPDLCGCRIPRAGVTLLTVHALNRTSTISHGLDAIYQTASPSSTSTW